MTAEKLTKADIEAVLSRWYDTHEYKTVTLDSGVRISVCARCEWPPALDGRCRCDWEKHGTDT